MAILVTSGQATSISAYLKSADLITGRNQNIGKGRLMLILRTSAAGMTFTLNCGGIALADDNTSPFIGTTGAMTVKDHVVVDQVVAGGRIELFLRNTTAGALTGDYALYFTPM